MNVTRPHVGPNLTCPGFTQDREPVLASIEREIPQSEVELYAAAVIMTNKEYGDGYVELTLLDIEPDGMPMPEGYTRAVLEGEWPNFSERAIPFWRALGLAKLERDTLDLEN